ncbi:MAG TPA: hypothetical protein VFT81_02495 [Dermatophilaceae bacterium]|nr:hypothetical protein [Dermatophilaceae bacterium]
MVLTSVSVAPVVWRDCSVVSDFVRRPAPVVRVSVLLGIRGVIGFPDLFGGGSRWLSDLSGSVSGGAVSEKHEGRGPGDVGFRGLR